LVAEYPVWINFVPFFAPIFVREVAEKYREGFCYVSDEGVDEGAMLVRRVYF
jgi:hypothetical protein